MERYRVQRPRGSAAPTTRSVQSTQWRRTETYNLPARDDDDDDENHGVGTGKDGRDSSANSLAAVENEAVTRHVLTVDFDGVLPAAIFNCAN